MHIFISILVVLAIIPWSLIIGVSYLACRRVRSQRAKRTEMIKRIESFWTDAKNPPVIDGSTFAESHARRVNEAAESSKPAVVVPAEPPEITQVKSRLQAAQEKMGFKLRDANHIAKTGTA